MEAYLFGNGASIPYGSPIGSHIFRRAFEIIYDRMRTDCHDNHYHYLKRELRSIITTMDELKKNFSFGTSRTLHIGRLLVKFDCLFAPSAHHDILHKEILNELSEYRIWEIFPWIITCYHNNDRYGFLDLRSKRLRLLDGLGNFYDEIAEFSFKAVYSAIACSNKDVGYYKAFVDYLNRRPEKKIVVINLNYDNLFEKAIREKYKGIVHYGFKSEIPCFPSPEAGSGKGQKLFLFKPHGSFDFLLCDSCDSITIAEDVSLEYFPDVKNKRRCQNPSCRKRDIKNFFIPYTAVVEPIRNRDILALVLDKMQELLYNVTRITAIGYSFSEYKGDLIDKHLVPIFENRKVIIVAKDRAENASICSRLEKYGINAINSGINGFADYVRRYAV